MTSYFSNYFSVKNRPAPADFIMMLKWNGVQFPNVVPHRGGRQRPQEGSALVLPGGAWVLSPQAATSLLSSHPSIK